VEPAACGTSGPSHLTALTPPPGRSAVLKGGSPSIPTKLVVAKSVAAGAAAPLAIRGPLATLLLRYANSVIMPAAACSQLVKVAAL
jgi:hypothetical protein